MSTNGSANNVTAIDVDMRNILRAKKTTLTAVGSESSTGLLFVRLWNISSFD